MLYSPGSKQLYNDTDSDIPSDAFLVLDGDAQTALCLGNGYGYTFNAPTIADGYGTLVIVPSDPDHYLSVIKNNQCALIDASYIAALSADIEFATAAGVTETYQADQQSLNTMMQTIIGSGGSLINGFVWGASDNTQVPFTFADLQGLANAIYMRGNGFYFHRQTKKAAIRACLSVEDVNLISW